MDQINAKEMEKIVREAGMYEENMSREEILSYYEAITNSKTTATTEDESREFNQSQIEAFEELVPSKVHSKRNSIKDESNDEVEALDACKANITFNDMQNVPKEKYLPVCYRPSKYVNIQNSKTFLDADFDIKAKMLYSHHTKMEKLKSHLCRQSFFTVPLPKPINIREMHVFPLSFDSDGLDTYISRSGRQTKRKIYNEDDDSNSGTFTNKKQKNVEVEWHSKLKPLRGSASKGYDLPEVTKTHNSESQSMTSSTPKSITNRTKRLTNAEIMEKSKLFEDLPPKTGTLTNTKTAEMLPKHIPKCKISTRSEEMFANLFKETEKKQKEEKAMEAFEETLEVSDEEMHGRKEPESEDIINIMDDEPTKRRIVPPNPLLKRRNIHSSSKTSPLVDTADSSKKENCLPKKKGKPKSESTKSSGDAVIKKNDNEPDGVFCPVCNNNFPVNKIQAHASSCGEEEIVQKYSTRQNLLCHICDKVFVSNYEQHVQECISRQKRLDKN